VLSFRRHSGGGGIDYELAKAVASSLGVKLKVVWYESENDEESNPVDEINAFMSYGLCQMSASFPLYADAIAQGPGRSVRLPRYRHMPEGDVGKIVDLSRLVVSRPYRSTRFVVVLPGTSTLKVTRLSDLDGRTILAEEGTVAGAIVMQYQGGRLRAKVDLVPPGPRTLWILEAGKHDAAIIELDKFDAHRKQNRISKLKLSGYEHSIRYNIALVSIARHKDLIAYANNVIAAGLKNSAIAAMAPYRIRPPCSRERPGSASLPSSVLTSSPRVDPPHPWGRVGRVQTLPEGQVLRFGRSHPELPIAGVPESRVG